jgi:hypothetical protein
MYVQPSTAFKYFHFCHILQRPLNLLYFLLVAAISSTTFEDKKNFLSKHHQLVIDLRSATNMANWQQCTSTVCFLVNID